MVALIAGFPFVVPRTGMCSSQLVSIFKKLVSDRAKFRLNNSQSPQASFERQPPFYKGTF
ncbi:hypothetical protein GCM10022209_14050 [Chitinophaga oryziterrae]